MPLSRHFSDVAHAAQDLNGLQDTINRCAEFARAYALSLHKPTRFLHVIKNDNKNSTFTHSDNFTNRNPVSIIQKCTYLQSSTAISFLTWCEQNVAASEAANFAIAASCKWQCALNLLQSCYNTIERTDQIYFNWHTVSCDCNITFWTSFMCSCMFV